MSNESVVEQAARSELCAVLDRLGADGTVASILGVSVRELHDAIWEHVQWLERRAHDEAIEKAASTLASQYTFPDKEDLAAIRALKHEKGEGA